MPHHGSCSISKTLQTITTLWHRARQINNYCPAVELIGNIAATIRQLTPLVSRYTSDPANSKMLAKIVQDREQLARESAALRMARRLYSFRARQVLTPSIALPVQP
jgi:thiamine pyrophosphate-dependent acetolactate synthase large subunit-like protein